MTDRTTFLDVEHRGALGILSMKPTASVALADMDYAHAVLEALAAVQAQGSHVRLVVVPAGNFGTERMARFWAEALGAPLDQPAVHGRLPHPVGFPAQVIRAENGVVQLLRLLRKVDHEPGSSAAS